MSSAELAGSSLLGSVVAIGVLAVNLNRHGVSGLLLRRKERHQRRAARFGAMAKWWDWFAPLAVTKFREYHAEELHEALCVRREGL